MTPQKETNLTYKDIDPAEAPIQVAMVYKNSYEEVSYVQQATDLSGGNNLFIVLLLSLMALITISRRPS